MTRQCGVECGKRMRMLRTVPALILGLLLGVVTASACGPSRTCNSVTCTGCCDTAGECRSGFDNSACGTKGSSCSTCGLGSTCLSGACSLSNSGAGTATGGGFSGTGGGAATSGGAAGGARAGGAAGGSVVACNSTNCPGCCDLNGACFTGQVNVACGTNGASCVACGIGQQCTPLTVGGRCLGNPTGGGSAGCNASNCSGCCRSNGQCQTSPTSAQCGANGSACMACPATQTCETGACRTCAGCIDLGTGTCVSGTSNSACGSSGAFCSSCSGTTPFCSSQRCTASPPPACSSANCTGCCDSMSGQCIPRGSQSVNQCGQGSNGAACVSCTSSCDTTAGQCSGGFPGVDGGLPPFPDGGIGSVCASGAQCGPGECCYLLFGLGGVCAGIGNPNLLGGTTCGLSQMMCGASCMGVQACVSGTCF